MLSPSEIREAKLEDVLRAVTWRNHIVHETGRLPDTIAEDSLTGAIWATLELAQTLGSKKFDLESTPEANTLASKISEIHKVTVREVRILSNHRFSLSIHTGVGPTLHSDELLAIVDGVKAICCTRDSRFNPETHLLIKFLRGLMGPYAIWSNGKLEMLPKATRLF